MKFLVSFSRKYPNETFPLEGAAREYFNHNVVGIKKKADEKTTV